MNSVRKRNCNPNFLQTALTIVLVTSALPGCSSKNEVDFESAPRAAVDKKFSIDGSKVILASTDADAMYNILTKNVEREVKGRGAKSFYGTASEDLLKAYDAGALTNINTDSDNNRTFDPLLLDVVGCAHEDSKFPMLKVRVTNKKSSGAEVWVAAHDIARFGHLMQ